MKRLTSNKSQKLSIKVKTNPLGTEYMSDGL